MNKRGVKTITDNKNGLCLSFTKKIREIVTFKGKMDMIVVPENKSVPEINVHVPVKNV
jgi:hypothetical protein